MFRARLPNIVPLSVLLRWWLPASQEEKDRWTLLLLHRKTASE